MTWISRVFFSPGGGAAVTAAPGVTAPLRPVSPWAGDGGNIERLVYNDLYGTSADEVSRLTAMTVSPIKRGRSIIVGTLADLPLGIGTWDGAHWTPDAEQPEWLNATTGVVTPWHRLAFTLDDILFAGRSLWVTERDSFGQITAAEWVSLERWEIREDSPTGVMLDGQPVLDPASVIFFQGPDEGLLATGADTIRAWRALARTRVAKARNPIPMTVLQEVDKNSVSQGEAEGYVEAWGNNRRQENGMVGFLPAKLKLDTHGDTKPEMFDTAFNALRLDAGNLLNLPASLLDGSTATASLTYVTQEGQRSALVDYLEYWLAPIEARLSQPDVTRPGAVVRFDRSTLSRVPNDSHGPARSGEPEAGPTAAPEAA